MAGAFFMLASFSRNPNSSRLNGLNPRMIKLLTYVILGVCVAVAGYIRISRGWMLK